MNQVVTFDNAEASSTKAPNIFKNFVYDNQTGGGALNKFRDISMKIDEIKKNVDELKNKYEQLQRIYEAFTNYDDVMNRNTTAAYNAVSDCKKAYDLLIEKCQEELDELAKGDKLLIGDIGNLAGMLASDNEDLSSKALKGSKGNK